MPYYENDWGEQFDDWDDALENTRDRMQKKDYEKYLGYSIPHDALLKWAMSQDQFWDVFVEEVNHAEINFFEDHCHEVEEREAEED